MFTQVINSVPPLQSINVILSVGLVQTFLLTGWAVGLCHLTRILSPSCVHLEGEPGIDQSLCLNYSSQVTSKKKRPYQKKGTWFNVKISLVIFWCFIDYISDVSFSTLPSSASMTWWLETMSQPSSQLLSVWYKV